MHRRVSLFLPLVDSGLEPSVTLYSNTGCAPLAFFSRLRNPSDNRTQHTLTSFPLDPYLYSRQSFHICLLSPDYKNNEHPDKHRNKREKRGKISTNGWVIMQHTNRTSGRRRCWKDSYPEEIFVQYFCREVQTNSRGPVLQGIQSWNGTTKGELRNVLKSCVTSSSLKPLSTLRSRLLHFIEENWCPTSFNRLLTEECFFDFYHPFFRSAGRFSRHSRWYAVPCYEKTVHHQRSGFSTRVQHKWSQLFWHR